MGSMLDEIAAATRTRVELRKGQCPSEQMAEMAKRSVGDVGSTGAYRTFQDAIAARGLSVIAEIKKASPPKGIISEDFPYADIAYDFEAGEADVVCCVTEPQWFMGDNEVLLGVRDEVSAPILRRDFVIDPYQVYETRYLGADAIVLTAALLSDAELSTLLNLCNDLHLDALVEVYDEREIERAINSNALIIGVNNRNPIDLAVDAEKALRLREKVPSDCLYVAESGISSVEEAARARDAGADAVLVGEFLMQLGSSDDRQDVLHKMKEIA